MHLVLVAEAWGIKIILKGKVIDLEIDEEKHPVYGNI